MRRCPCSAAPRLLPEFPLAGNSRLPITEPSTLAILRAAERFEGLVIPTPDIARFAAVSDKSRVLSAGERLGISVPRQVILPAAGTTAGEAVRDLPLPLVIKPAASVVAKNGGLARLRVSYAATPDELEAALADIPPSGFPVLLQERIRGPGIGVFLLLWDGELLAHFGHRRVREKPPSGGASVDRESIAVSDGLLARSVSLMREFDWRGVAMIEYKVDERTNEPVLMEVNGRFWGSLQLAIDAGVDFPSLLVDAALGRPRTVRSYRIGVRTRWFWGDVDQLLQRLRHPPAKLHLEGAQNRKAALADFMRASWTARNEVLRIRDPAPGLLESWHWLRRRASSSLRRGP